MNKIVKIIFFSLQFILAAAVIMIIYGFFAGAAVNLDLIFNACFFIGALIICVALVIKFSPFRFFFDKLTDHSNFKERYWEQRERKNEKASEYLLMGITVIVITGLLQIVVWLFNSVE